MLHIVIRDNLINRFIPKHHSQPTRFSHLPGFIESFTEFMGNCEVNNRFVVLYFLLYFVFDLFSKLCDFGLYCLVRIYFFIHKSFAELINILTHNQWEGIFGAKSFSIHFNFLITDIFLEIRLFTFIEDESSILNNFECHIFPFIINDLCNFVWGFLWFNWVTFNTVCIDRQDIITILLEQLTGIINWNTTKCGNSTSTTEVVKRR
jgi:hypothetical protein